ncbi:MAG TPA: antibiotic biosynthesis monooxygenase [Dehalococcoidia bacterium]|nr:antibiotic biosynthesis monooxygenase [Dehalococcoidia bacterium]
MAVLLVRHKVADYDKWRQVYEEDAAQRKAAGCSGTHLFRNAKDPNDITINFQWDSIENAEKFFGDPKLQEVLQSGGVIGQPDVWFVDDAGRTAS